MATKRLYTFDISAKSSSAVSKLFKVLSFFIYIPISNIINGYIPIYIKAI